MENSLDNKGFRNLDSANGTIAKVMESLRIYDDNREWNPGLVGLAVAGRGYTDERIAELADRIPTGSKLWMFSPTPREVVHPRLKLTHVVAGDHREFALKIASHLERSLRNVDGNDPGFADVDYGEEEVFAPIRAMRTRGVNKVGAVELAYAADLTVGDDHLIVDLGDGHTPIVTEPNDVWLPESGLKLSRPAGGRQKAKLTEVSTMSVAVDMATATAKSLGLPSYRIVYTGVGVGGALALKAASVSPGAKAVVDNVSWSPKLMGHWGCASADKVDPVREWCGILDGFLNRNSQIARVLLAQNDQNTSAFEQVFKPLRAHYSEMGDAAGGISFVAYTQRHLTLNGRLPLKHSARKKLIANTLAALEVPPVLDRAFITR